MMPGFDNFLPFTVKLDTPTCRDISGRDNLGHEILGSQ